MHAIKAAPGRRIGRRHGFRGVNQIRLGSASDHPARVRSMAILLSPLRYSATVRRGRRRLRRPHGCAARMRHGVAGAAASTANPYRPARRSPPGRAGRRLRCGRHRAYRAGLRGASAPRPRRPTAPERRAPPADRRWLEGAAAIARRSRRRGVLVLRVPIVAALPWLGGLPADADQLEFQRVHSETVDHARRQDAARRGRDRQPLGRRRRAAGDPHLAARRRTAPRSIRGWSSRSIAGLAPGGSIGFRSALAAPPAKCGSQVTLNLAARESDRSDCADAARSGADDPRSVRRGDDRGAQSRDGRGDRRRRLSRPAGRLDPQGQLRLRRRPDPRAARRPAVAGGRVHLAVELPRRHRRRPARSSCSATSRATSPGATCCSSTTSSNRAAPSPSPAT